MKKLENTYKISTISSNITIKISYIINTMNESYITVFEEDMDGFIKPGEYTIDKNNLILYYDEKNRDY